MKESFVIEVKASNDIPMIYIADLAAYNAGMLRGEWIEVEPYPEDRLTADRISELLEEWDAEEYAVHDHQGFPPGFVTEHPNLEALEFWAELVEHDEELAWAYSAIIDDAHGLDPWEWKQDMQDRFLGSADSATDYAAELVETSGYIQEDLPWWIAVDYTATARNLALHNSEIFIRVKGTVYVFNGR